jgi:adenine/guanine phosphoribosyltransferase-like PRPP-binding protein
MIIARALNHQYYYYILQLMVPLEEEEDAIIPFDKITSKFQLRLKDRLFAANNILAESLKDIIKDKEEQKAAVVLDIPRGGVIIADIIAIKLSSNYFHIIIPRKLGAPYNEELACLFPISLLDLYKIGKRRIKERK